MQEQPHPHLPSDDDGASDDDPASVAPPSAFDPLHHAHVLTQEQLLYRRASRLRHLLRIYRAQYWGLLEEMRSKYRRFYLRHGKSGWRRDGTASARDDADLTPGEMKQPHAPETPGMEVSRCGAQGCLAKPLLLSSYCYAHILQEPRQRLYKPCSFIVRRGSGKNANILCQKPVLQAVSPPCAPPTSNKLKSSRPARYARLALCSRLAPSQSPLRSCITLWQSMSGSFNPKDVRFELPKDAVKLAHPPPGRLPLTLSVSPEPPNKVQLV